MFRITICPIAIVFFIASSLGYTQPQNDAPNQDAGEIQQAPLGHINNPVKCDDPGGEHYYLSRLVDPQGRDVSWGRMGSFTGGTDGHILDGYQVTVGDQKLEIYMDMYHQGYYEERPVPGFYLRCRMSWDLVIKDDGLRYTIDGEKPYDGEYVKKDETTGKTIAQVTVRNGLLQGIATRYHKNGAPSQIVPYQDGLEQGNAQYFNEDKQLTTTINYDEGQRHGKAFWYRPDGSIDAMYTYAKGSLDGPCYETYPHGSKKQTGQFKNQKRDGEWISYDAEGNITKRDVYRDGELIVPNVENDAKD